MKLIKNLVESYSSTFAKITGVIGLGILINCSPIYNNNSDINLRRRIDNSADLYHHEENNTEAERRTLEEYDSQSDHNSEMENPQEQAQSLLEDCLRARSDKDLTAREQINLARIFRGRALQLIGQYGHNPTIDTANNCAYILSGQGYVHSASDAVGGMIETLRGDEQ